MNTFSLSQVTLGDNNCRAVLLLGLVARKCSIILADEVALLARPLNKITRHIPPRWISTVYYTHRIAQDLIYSLNDLKGIREGSVFLVIVNSYWLWKRWLLSRGPYEP